MRLKVLEALVWLALIVTASIVVGSYSAWAFAQPDTVDTRPRGWESVALIGAVAVAAGVLGGYVARPAARPVARAVLIPGSVGLTCGFMAFWVVDVVSVASPCDLGSACDISAAPFAVIAATVVTVVVGGATALGYVPVGFLRQPGHHST